MSRKRRNSSSPECEESPLRQRSTSASLCDSEDYEDETSARRELPQVDSTSGQSGAFPGIGQDDEPFYGPAADGIDYIRMVRSEARGIPHLLTSQNEAAQEKTGVGEPENFNGGYYFDGAYTARPSMLPQDQSSLSQSQMLYYDSLLTQFNLIRATMKCIPPLSEVEKLSSSQPISFPSESSAARKVWKDQIDNFDPHPVQVACMDGDSALQLLKLIARRIFMLFKTQDTAKVKRLGAWIWAILGKAPDRGLLGSEEIGDLRYLAKRAKSVMDTLNEVADEGAVLDENDEDIEDEEDVKNDIGSDIRAARQRLETAAAERIGDGKQSQEDGAETAANFANRIGNSDVQLTDLDDRFVTLRQVADQKSIVLDMIITVVGEVYGQRDMLELRHTWKMQTS